MDLEAAKSAWPNFGVFYSCFKNLAAIGASASVEDMVAISAAVELDPELPSTLSSVQSENVDDSSKTKIEKEPVPRTSRNKKTILFSLNSWQHSLLFNNKTTYVLLPQWCLVPKFFNIILSNPWRLKSNLVTLCQ